MGAYERLQSGLFIMGQGDRESKRHGHGPAPEYKGETAIHAMTMPPFYIVAQLKYTGTGFTKQTSSAPVQPHPLPASGPERGQVWGGSGRRAIAHRRLDAQPANPHFRRLSVCACTSPPLNRSCRQGL